MRLLKKNIFIRICVFVSLFLLITVKLSYFLQPVWREWNNYDTLHGFYEEPDNTIETIFLGASIVANGIVPMELYKNQGICSYNLGTEEQPMLASYYWMEEAYRLHSQTLKNVVLDVSMLRRTPQSSAYQKALDALRLSKVKYQAMLDYAGSLNKALSYLLPIFEYHNRWQALDTSDFKKTSYSIRKYLRGYNFNLDRWFFWDEYTKFDVPVYYTDESVGEQTMDPEAMSYLNRMVEFCRKHDLKLVLIKTPVIAYWEMTAHNSVESIAKQYDLEFYDFNYAPYIDEIGYDHAWDSIDGLHMNYGGALKFTNWLGKYLVEKCNATDVRQNEKYNFMKEELEEYDKNVTAVYNLKNTEDPVKYIQAASSMHNSIVFISIKDDGVMALSEGQKRGFTAIGLKNLSELTYRSSYIAVIKDGEVLEEQAEFWDQEAYDKRVNAQMAESGEIAADEGQMEPISVEGKVGKTSYQVISGGCMMGNISSILINQEEYSINGRGFNIVVYNYLDKEIIDAANFDTFAAPTRIANAEEQLRVALEEGVSYTDLIGDVKKLYLYNRRCDNARISGALNITSEQGLYNLLEAYRSKEDYVICISAQDDAANSLDEKARKYFADIGLEELSSLKPGDSYIGILDGENMICDRKDHGDAPISEKGMIYTIISGGYESGNISSIKINGEEYSGMGRGLNIAVYDKQLGAVINQATFDTSAFSAVIP